MSTKSERKRALQTQSKKDAPRLVKNIFYNDGDIAVGIRRNGFEYQFREDLEGQVGAPLSREDFKALLPLNRSLAGVWEQHANGHPNLVPTLLELVQEHRAERLSHLRSWHGTAAAKPAA